MLLSVRKIALSCAAIVLLACAALPVQATAGTSIRASIPKFPITLNNTSLDQAYSEYPFLLYKDITYMPMTWNNLQSLNIEYQWSDDAGLILWPNRNYPPPIRTSRAEQDLSKTRNSTSYSVQLASFPIQFGDKKIENAEEPYPFLTFRDITYIPLTWQFAHDLLRLDLVWNEQTGLGIIGGQNVMQDSSATMIKPCIFILCWVRMTRRRW
ncbi:hypothetical protein [Bacillus sp. 3255]|uniref:hypothetical protein n=1 Tax=Bacillus sp. 3255 TaxID=2817904 RepID=UPI00285D6F01|nr:hypothetical protein [Bacillus sp. 3255]MDR6884049.1 hypothetical protein [Bacillus sp. 3255]